MRLPDPLTNPEYHGLGFETAQLVDNDPVIRDELPNGKVAEFKVAAQYWSINLTYPDLFMDEYTFLETFIQSYKRSGGYIEVLLPQYEAFRVKSSTALVNIAAGQKGSSITMTNTSSLIGEPQAGDLFKLSTHPKVYKIVSVYKTTNSITLGLYPDLFITTTGSEKPVFNGILFRTKLMNGNTFGQPLDADGKYSGVSLVLRESL